MKEGRIILKKHKRNRFWFLGIIHQQKQFNVLFLNQSNVSKYRTLLSPVLKFVILRLCTYTLVFINVFQTPIQQLFRFERIYVRFVLNFYLIRSYPPYTSVFFTIIFYNHYLKIIFMFRHRMKPIINDSINVTLSARSCVPSYL